MTDIWALSDLCTPWCVHVVATLRVAHHIEAGHRRIGDLADAAGADRDALHRVLRHLIEKGMFEEPAPGTFALNDAARPLLDEGVLVGFDLDSFGGRMAHAWNSLLTAVRTGRPAYHEIFGRPFWDDLQAHPAIAERFDALMGPLGHGVPDPEVLLSGDWTGVRHVSSMSAAAPGRCSPNASCTPEVRESWSNRARPWPAPNAPSTTPASPIALRRSRRASSIRCRPAPTSTCSRAC